MGAAQTSESYDAEKGGDAQRPNIIHGLKRRSSITLKAIVRTFSLPGGKNVDSIPSPQQSQPPPLQEEERAATLAQERSAGCCSSPMSDVELTVTEVAGGEGASGDTAAPHATLSSTQANGDSARPASC